MLALNSSVTQSTTFYIWKFTFFFSSLFIIVDSLIRFRLSLLKFWILAELGLTGGMNWLPVGLELIKELFSLFMNKGLAADDKINSRTYKVSSFLFAVFYKLIYQNYSWWLVEPVDQLIIHHFLNEFIADVVLYSRMNSLYFFHYK